MRLARLPMNPFDELRREMERVVTGLGLDAAHSPFAPPAAFPALNIWDAGDAVCVEAELPGFNRDDLEVYAVANELTIKGRRVRPDDEQRVYHRQERAAGEFTRIVTLPVEVNAERVEATLKDGVLTLHLPKVQAHLPRKIAVKAN